MPPEFSELTLNWSEESHIFNGLYNKILRPDGHRDSE